MRQAHNDFVFTVIEEDASAWLGAILGLLVLVGTAAYFLHWKLKAGKRR
jgi:hypothetical protein